MKQDCMGFSTNMEKYEPKLGFLLCRSIRIIALFLMLLYLSIYKQMEKLYKNYARVLSLVQTHH